jgi:hypothetical protein
MAQKLINIGTVANDGTGDTIRGAFTNVNANFTEVYSNVATLVSGQTSNVSTLNTAISSAYTVANAAYNQANSANVLAYNTGIGANTYAATIVGYSNTWSNVVAASSNSWANTVGLSANSYAGAMANSVNVAQYTYSNVSAVACNNWANSVVTSSNIWTFSTFTTLANSATIYNNANAAFLKANNALPNTTGTLSGALTVTGALSGSSVNDALGPVRESFSNTINSNVIIQLSGTVIIANNPNTIYVSIDNDGNFLLPANVGTSIDFYQFGSGNTGIKSKDATVTIYSANNWANIAGQYLSASLVKVKANTWILTGSLKP